jgi:hypothetical protein
MNPSTSPSKTPAAADQSVHASFSRLDALRILLALDAVVLFMLGALLIFAPKRVEWAFHFKDLPEGVSYIIGLWGCVLVTMAIGYAVAATNPLRHVVWVQVGIARGALECVLGAVYLAKGVVTWQQAGVGIIVAAFITVAYLVIYPRKTHVVRMAADQRARPVATPGPTP